MKFPRFRGHVRKETTQEGLVVWVGEYRSNTEHVRQEALTGPAALAVVGEVIADRRGPGQEVAGIPLAA